MTNHTPKPWRWVTSHDGYTELFGANDKLIITEATGADEHGWATPEGVDIPNQADKVLIEAAPDLLEACQAALDILNTARTLDDALCAVPFLDDARRVAIAKANGGEQ